jgi:hypothetical protein
MRVPLSIVMQPPPYPPPSQRDHWLSDWRGPRFLDRKKKNCSRKQVHVHPYILPFTASPPPPHLPFFLVSPPSTHFHLFFCSLPFKSSIPPFLTSTTPFHSFMFPFLIQLTLPFFLLSPISTSFYFTFGTPIHTVLFFHSSFPSLTSFHSFFYFIHSHTLLCSLPQKPFIPSSIPSTTPFHSFLRPLSFTPVHSFFSSLPPYPSILPSYPQLLPSIISSLPYSRTFLFFLLSPPHIPPTVHNLFLPLLHTLPFFLLFPPSTPFHPIPFIQYYLLRAHTLPFHILPPCNPRLTFHLLFLHLYILPCILYSIGTTLASHLLFLPSNPAISTKTSLLQLPYYIPSFAPFRQMLTRPSYLSIPPHLPLSCLLAHSLQVSI